MTESGVESPAQTWFRAPVSEGSHGLVTLVEGSSFCVAGRSGDIHPGRSEGLYFLDTRFLSRLELFVDGQAVEPLSVQVEDPFSSIHIGRARPGESETDPPVAVTRRRYVGRGMRDDLEIHNYDIRPADHQVSIRLDADFANLFAVKAGLSDPGLERSATFEGGTLRFSAEGEPAQQASVSFNPPPDRVEGDAPTWLVHLVGGASWNLCLEVTIQIGGEPIRSDHACGTPVHHADPATRLAIWRSDAPSVETEYAPLANAVHRAAEDLGALRIFDPDHPDRVVVAAGAPWFMTLFGRDSLLTSWMALLADSGLALGVLRTLADLQGEELDPETEEQPGRILHEVRFGKVGSLSLGGGHIYYGSIDSTPLFVMLAGELLRWGVADDAVSALMPHIDRAMEWIERYGDRDGDGYVEYERLSPGGLLHQGWKDSHDGVRYASGDLARPPIALCEVQGYVYAAHLARARLADHVGDRAASSRHLEQASQLKESFNRDFWSEKHNRYLMGLDGAKSPIDSLVSNIGHCLWTGIIAEDRAESVATHLMSPEMFSGWGLRTLATSMAAYNPVSYHCGSVWPHDTALAVAGLRRYGFIEEANRLALALLDLAATEGGRLPELVAGFSRDEFGEPVPYPTSCSPQAWAAASPLLLVREFLGLEPDLPAGELHLRPALPNDISHLRVEGIPLAGSRLTIDVAPEGVSVAGVPSAVEIVDGR